MRKEVVLVTGANGEVGHGLIPFLSEHSNVHIVAMDIRPLEESLKKYCYHFILGDILDTIMLGRLVFEYDIHTIYHLASILSTRAEYNPEAAHRVNVEGTLNLLRLAVEQSQWQKRPVKFLYPSSIAVYGLPNLETKAKAGRVSETEWLNPTTMYGCNKLYCEHLGRYHALYYKQLVRNNNEPCCIDFRCVRYPGLISAVTLPAGGTSDYAPEMIHHAAQGMPYKCFVRKESRLPFMVMPDAIKSLVKLAESPIDSLTRHIYNVTSFSLSAGDILSLVKEAFPKVEVDFEPDRPRQAIVDSWPADIDDTAARRDWNWTPDYDVRRSFSEYLIPGITQRYLAGVE